MGGLSVSEGETPPSPLQRKLALNSKASLSAVKLQKIEIVAL